MTRPAPMHPIDHQNSDANWFAESRAELVRFCQRYLGQSADAEDVVQEVGARLAAQERVDEPRPWMFRVARNLCLNLLRDRSGGVDGALTLHTEIHRSPRTGPGTALDRNERDAAVRAALESMQTNLAEVLTLRYFEGFGQREIADVLERPERQVKAELDQARQEIARKLKDMRGSGR